MINYETEVRFMKNMDKESVELLYKALVSINTVEDCRKFLDDICTINEIQDLAQRLSTAIMLDNGENYSNISQKLGTSAATISRVSRCLNYGEGGYKNVIANLKEKSNAN